MFQTITILQQQIAEIWKRFGVNQKANIILALLVCIVVIGGLLYWSSRPDYRMVYSNLTLSDASTMREKLQDAKIPVEVRDAGRALYVPAKDVYNARLMLAGEGLPKESNSGFELFEQPKFGLTDFAQQVNYQRALQGELERTLSSLNNIQSARVTLVLPKDKLFASEEEKDARASIMLTMSAGASLPAAQVRSISHLVSSAVPGLKPSSITVVDQDGRLLSAASESDPDQMVMAGDQMTIQKTLETQLARNVQDILDRFMGKDRSVVKVSAEMDFSRIEKRAERFDKEGRLVKTEKIQSESSSKPGSGMAGGPGTMANTTVGENNVKVEQGQAKTKKENIQNEYITPTEVESMLQTGARIKRLSISACVAKGQAPRSKADLDAIEDLVKGAVGYVSDPITGRLDMVQVKEMEFMAAPTDVAAPWYLRLPIGMESLVRGIMMGLLLLVVYVAGRKIMGKARIQGSAIGVPVKSISSEMAGERALSDSKAVDIDLFETLQSVKEDPKKAAAWITRAIEMGG